MNKQTNKRWYYPDLTGSVRSHLMDEHHSRMHRFFFGFLISIFGVCVSHYTSHIGMDALAILGHHLGYGIHGIGYIPMYKAIEKKEGKP
jgi:hypothetical protein